MEEEFEIEKIESTFDFKGFLLKLLSYWPLFLISLAIAFGIAYYINVRKLPVYRMQNLVTIKDDQNPFFTTNTSLTFNWGGTTDKVNTAITILESRSHNESVVERLQYYLNYQKDGKYKKIDAYKKTPFFVEVDTLKPQILGQEIHIQFKDSITFTVTSDFGEGGLKRLQVYDTKAILSRNFESGTFSQDFKLGEKIELPFFNGRLLPREGFTPRPGVPYYLSFSNFDAAVKRYRISILQQPPGSSVLRLNMVGTNKAKLVDYLNTSVQVLQDNALERKNLFATKTIKFIDSMLQRKSEELLDVEDELNDFKNKSAVLSLESEGAQLQARLNNLDIRKEGVEQKLNYYRVLEDYLINRKDYRSVPAPSVAGIKEGSIVSGVGKIVSLAQDRSKLEYSFKEGAPVFDDIDRQIDALKKVLLENITSSKGLINQELSTIIRDIARYEAEIRRLPKEQQDLFKIERRYNLSQGSYNLFLSKLSEANLVKAANVSDVLVIDSAKDTGGGQVGPNTQLNYILSVLYGFLIPFIFVFLRVFFDTKIHTVKDVERLSKIPMLGVVGKNTTVGNLAVLERPKSAIAEAFRALRSSLQFIYKRQGIDGAKTVLVTSSVSGEGKTFTSINIASVFALSEKKTVLLGLDLRKPKIFDDFNINNSAGVVNYLINDLGLEGIIQKTQLDHFDIITSGPIPPNPSELLMGERMELLINELKSKYDYIILDSPPLGLVSDSLELIKFADATIYMVRQNYTKKGMFRHINDKYRRGEVSNVSFVLNFYEDKASYGYGYGYGYGKYGNGYHEDGAKPSIWKKIKRFFKLSN